MLSELARRLNWSLEGHADVQVQAKEPQHYSFVEPNRHLFEGASENAFESSCSCCESNGSVTDESTQSEIRAVQER